MKFQVKSQTQFAADLVERIVNNQDKNVVVFLPGGSVTTELPVVVEKLLDLDSLDFLTITLIDERYAEDHLHADSNAVHIENDADIKKLKDKGAILKCMLQQGKLLDETAVEFNKFVESVFADPNTHTIGVLGVANDGHFAGILPHKQEYYAKFSKDYVTGYDIREVSIVDNPHQYRLTLNYAALSELDEVLLFAVGQRKYRVLKDLVSMSAPTIKEISRQPVFFLHELDAPVTIYTDQELYG